MSPPPALPPGRECRVFTRYLIGADPDNSVAATYQELSSAAAFGSRTWDRFDHFLVRMAAWHPVAAVVADLHARFFRPHTLLRHKLVLLLAILEVAPGTAARLQGSGGGLARTAGTVALAGLVSVAALLAGLVVLLPARLLLAGRTVSATEAL